MFLFTQLLKKMVYLIIPLFLISSFINNVYADITSSLVRNNDSTNDWHYKFNITVTLPVDAPDNSYILILNLYPGKTLSDLNNIVNAKDVVKYIDQVDKPKNGINNSVTFEVIMDDDDPSGNYSFTTAYYKNGGYINESSRFFYVSSTDRLKYVEYFNNPTLSDIDIINLLTKNIKYYNFMGFNYIYYSKYILPNVTTKDYFTNSLITNKPQNGYDENTLMNALNNSSFLIALNKSADITQFRNIIEDTNLIIKEKVYKSDGDFANLPDTSEGKGYVYTYLYNLKETTPFTGLDTGTNSLVSAFNAITALVVINDATETSVERLIDTYYAYVGISSDDYQYYKKNNTNRNIINKYITLTDYKNPMDIGVSFTNKINELKTVIVPPKPTSKPSGGSNRNNADNSSVVLTLTPTPTPIPMPENDIEKNFPDLNGYEWAEKSINELSNKGIINGFEDGLFKPSAFVTREQFVKMLMLALKFNVEKTETSYNDVKETDWFYPYVSTALKNNIIKGMGDNYFGTGRYISRQDMAVMIYRASKLYGLKLAENPTNVFVDKNISDYSKDAVLALSEAKIILGNENNEFKPLEFATRAESVTILCRLMNFLIIPDT